MENGQKYTTGRFINHETGPGLSLLTRVREFKLFNHIPEDINSLEIPFVNRIAKFANACLNRRANGTIFFGKD